MALVDALRLSSPGLRGIVPTIHRYLSLAWLPLTATSHLLIVDHMEKLLLLSLLAIGHRW